MSRIFSQSVRPAGVAAAAAAIAVAEGGASVGATVAPATNDALTRDAAWERIALVCFGAARDTAASDATANAVVSDNELNQSGAS